MKKAKVFFAPVADAESLESQAEKAVQLAEAAEFAKVIQKGRPCALKTHFGEGAGRRLPPAADLRRRRRMGPARRRPAVPDRHEHALPRPPQPGGGPPLAGGGARLHVRDAVRAPVIIADGLHGADQVAVPIAGGRRFKEVRIASALHQAPSAVVLTHVKGHLVMGFGGSIKNVGMGCAARAGKLAQHQGGHPKFDEKKCKSCGTCVRWCPTDALSLRGKLERVALEPEKCIGCGECLALCPFDAIGFDWSTHGPELTEKVCEHVLGFLSNKAGRVGYLNFVTHVTKNCDCMGEQAEGGAAEHRHRRLDGHRGGGQGVGGPDAWSATARTSGRSGGRSPTTESQFDYGEKLGIGTREYELKEI